MEKKGTFAEIGKTEDRMYGPRALLVCGYEAEERSVFLSLIEKTVPADIRVVFASTPDLGTCMGDLVIREDNTGSTEASAMPRAVIMSGLKENELHGLMAAYKESGFKRQIWAALTPVSEKWPLKSLLKELQAEDMAMRVKKKDLSKRS